MFTFPFLFSLFLGLAIHGPNSVHVLITLAILGPPSLTSISNCLLFTQIRTRRTSPSILTYLESSPLIGNRRWWRNPGGACSSRTLNP
ncbi:hypothetical protein V8F06_008069 [Rhypophila decipiens]